jgi:cytochrome c553
MVAIFACTKDKTTPTTTASTTTTCTDTIRYSVEIQDMITTSCISCHNVGGEYPDLSTHSNVSLHANSVYNSINSGSMPKYASKLSDTTIQNMQCWIGQGKSNN